LAYKLSLISLVMAFANRGAQRLRALLSDPNRIISAPGVYDGLTARLALAEGFDCLYMTGAGTSISRLGMADLVLCTQADMISNAAMIASLDPSTPLIADADTGYGGPIMVKRTVEAYARAGVAALHLEDQVQEKRCGQLLGKQLVEREVWYAKLRAAVQARDDIGSEMVIIARTDARAGVGFDEAIDRLKGAVEAGADVLFLEALQSHEEAKMACEIFKGTPMLLNMVPSGVTPNMSLAQARELGFRIVIWPSACLEPVALAARQGLKSLKSSGSMQEGSVGPKEMFMVCGLQDLMNIDKRAGAKSFANI